MTPTAALALAEDAILAAPRPEAAPATRTAKAKGAPRWLDRVARRFALSGEETARFGAPP